MFRWISIILLSVGILAVAFWGYEEHQEKNAILIQAENNYQRSFHGLTYHVDLLHDKIGATLAMNSQQQLSPQLAEIWRLTSEAMNEVGQLPLALLPFNKTEEFLADMGDFSYQTAIRDLDSEPLSEKETKKLEKLYQSAGEIESELRKVQHLVLKDNLRWMDVQLAIANEDEQMDNTIIDGFKTVEKTVESFSEGSPHNSLTSISNNEDRYSFHNEPIIKKEEAEAISRNHFDINDSDEITLVTSGKGAQFPFYSASYHDEEKEGYLDISANGGHLLTLMINREIKEPKIGLNEAMNKASKYLENKKFPNMSVMESNQYDRIGVFHFVTQEDDKYIYPEAIQVKVALDNGEIIGVSAKDYYQNKKSRKEIKPAISLEEAQKKVNKNLDIKTNHLAIIDNQLGEEVFVYGFIGTLGDDTYKIFINAENGQEENVVKLKQSETKY
ncbi:germination protein YpeB [Saliterribacillus persicus]|uniref:Spore germination protein n=1 Tax=Saliterribacillus persicus TaxID=930114 RepID=A0A368XAL4_9BACI|nr:germination protein YpeB [Saliterribacillus persicus]RCW64895.1 spore germination protein [Saliterribacillus persicus]